MTLDRARIATLLRPEWMTEAGLPREYGEIPGVGVPTFTAEECAVLDGLASLHEEGLLLTMDQAIPVLEVLLAGGHADRVVYKDPTRLAGQRLEYRQVTPLHLGARILATLDRLARGVQWPATPASLGWSDAAPGSVPRCSHCHTELRFSEPGDAGVLHRRIPEPPSEVAVQVVRLPSGETPPPLPRAAGRLVRCRASIRTTGRAYRCKGWVAIAVTPRTSAPSARAVGLLARYLPNPLEVR